jgi:hypothetical protein
MKKLGTLSVGLDVFRGDDGDIIIQEEDNASSRKYYLGYPGDGFEGTLKELAELTKVDPHERLISAVRAAVASYHDESLLEIDLDPLTDALDAFDAAVAERQ